MFGKLKGYVDSVFDDHILFDVNGVCYTVVVDRRTLFNLANNKTKTELFIETIMRENIIMLFGFLDFESQVWFRELIKLNGISGKIAMAILGSFDIQSLGLAITTKDEKLISTVPGIGKKLANRIVNEMEGVNDKISSQIMTYQPVIKKVQYQVTSQTESTETHNLDHNAVAIEIPSAINYQVIQDAINALCSLGFSRNIAYNIIQDIAKQNPKIELNDLVKEGIKKIGNK